MDIKDEIFTKVAEVTGRDIDELDDDLSLQLDLGIDSLKIMSLWQSIMPLLPIGVQIDQQSIANITQLSELVEAVVEMANSEVSSKALEAYCSTADPGGERIAMTHSQQFFVVSHQLVKSTSLCSKVELDGFIDTNQVTKAWQALVQRHVNLRTSFYIPSDGKKLTDIEYRLLENTEIKNVREVDMSHLTEEESEAQLDDFFHDELNRK